MATKQATLFDEAAPEVYDVAAHEETMRRMREGEITAKELYWAYSQFSANEAEIRAELTRTHTVPQLKAKLVWPSGNKARLVGAVYDNMLQRYAAPVKDTIGYSPMSETFAEAVDRTLSAVTDEMLAAYAADFKAEKEAFVKSLTDPETLEEFKTFAYRRGLEPMTNEQLTRYDALLWAESRKRRSALVLAAIERDQRESRELTAEHAGLLKIKQSWHGKRKCDIWIVGLTQYIDGKATFRALASQARQFSARWSKFGPEEDHGFIFWTEADALAFMKLAGGGEVDMEAARARRAAYREAKAADRLAQYATFHVERSNDALAAERLTNTWRRVQMARNAEANARGELRFAQLVADLALAMEIGELEALADVRFATQLALLLSLYDESWRTAVQSENDGQYVAPGERRLFKVEDIRHAQLPFPRLDVRQAEQVAKTLHGKRGVGLAKRILQDGVKKAREANRHWMTLQPAANVAEVLTALPKSGDLEFNERFADWKRLVSLGLTSGEELRHALRELHRYVVAEVQADPVREAIRELVGGGKIVGFYPTPKPTLKILKPWLPCPVIRDDGRPMVVLEPSAGIGNILDWLVDCYPLARFVSHEINYRLVDILRMKGHETVVVDYLKTETVPFADLIVANPPFEDGQDIDHFYHSLAQLREGGRLIYIIFESSFTRSDQKATAFQAFVGEFAAHVEKLPARSFHESGTDVATRFVVVDADDLRPEAA
jgi:hypothetical protein